MNSAFIGADSTTTGVHVLLDGASLFGGEVGGYGNGPIFSATIVSTASVPEPTTIVLLGPGLAGTSIFTRRRRRSIATGP